MSLKEKIFSRFRLPQYAQFGSLEFKISHENNPLDIQISKIYYPKKLKKLYEANLLQTDDVIIYL